MNGTRCSFRNDFRRPVGSSTARELRSAAARKGASRSLGYTLNWTAPLWTHGRPLFVSAKNRSSMVVGRATSGTARENDSCRRLLCCGVGGMGSSMLSPTGMSRRCAFWKSLARNVVPALDGAEIETLSLSQRPPKTWAATASVTRYSGLSIVAFTAHEGVSAGDASGAGAARTVNNTVAARVRVLSRGETESIGPPLPRQVRPAGMRGHR